MRRVTLVVLGTLLAGCTWSNSLYHARRLTRAAEQMEREERSFDAGTLWGQVATKADSAYARAPGGIRGAEALWLRGRALARLNDCTAAAPVLEQAFLAAPEAEWIDQLRLELGRCRDQTGDPRAVDALLPLIDSPDSAVRIDARRRTGRALVTLGRWEEALDALEGLEGNAARAERGISLAALGRTDEALAELDVVVQAQDTTVAWERVLTNLAARDGQDAEALLARLLALPGIGTRQQAEWNLAVGRGAAMSPAARERYLTNAARLTGAAAAGRARLLLVEDRLAVVATPAALAEVVETFDLLSEGDVTVGFDLTRYEKFADALLEDVDTVAVGAPLGDLAFFHQAEIARDSLRAPALANWLFRRLEVGWPDSPYVPKALFARLLIDQDSTATLRQRLATFNDSPYLAFVRGEAPEAFRVLEDSLGRYLGDRAAAAAVRQLRTPTTTVNE